MSSIYEALLLGDAVEEICTKEQLRSYDSSKGTDVQMSSKQPPQRWPLDCPIILKGFIKSVKRYPATSTQLAK
jgi:hypothetical protein